MRTVFGPVLLAVTLAATGGALWVSGQLERRLADAERQLLAFDSAALPGRLSAIEQSVGYDRWLPWIASVKADAARDRAVSAFWSRDYGALDVPRDTNGAVAESDPAILLLEVNALYRAAESNRDDPQFIRRLESVLELYIGVLKRAPGDVTAAYNYELVSRVRDILARSTRSRESAKQRATSPHVRLPQTIHGDQGAPPPDADLSIFQTIVPKEGDERRETEEAGKGEQRVRKG